MNKILLLLCALVTFLVSSHAQDNILINAYNRPSTSLNGAWSYIVDPYETGYYDYRYTPHDQSANPGNGAFYLNAKPKDKTDMIEYDFDQSPTMQIPGDWNSQVEKLYYYEGTVWYKKSFDYKVLSKDKKIFLSFGAVNYRADVYFNGKKLGVHEGGFTPFNFDITGLVKEKGNFVIVKVDNKRKKEAVPTLNTDWWNYGGITRDVKLIEVPETFINDYFIQLAPKNKQLLSGYIALKGSNVSGKKIALNIPELKINKELVTDSTGRAVFSIKLNKITFWSPDNPFLYDVFVKTNDEELQDQIGLRTIETQEQNILLNGKSIFLRGICIHEENPLRQNRAYSLEDAKLLLTWAKELGCNYVRLAHYPHNEHVVRLADQMGLMVWEEIPVYWTIQWDNPQTYANAENQLKEVINRDKNRASSIIWSMANETPVSKPRTDFLLRLATKTRELDPTRLVSAALEIHATDADPFTKTIDDPFANYVDVLSFNQYVGWYDGLPDKIDRIQWNIKQNKPVLISEFGADAKYGLHGDSLTRWSEEYQKVVYEKTIKMLQRIPQWRGVTPWILVDFRSPRRLLPGVQDGFNRKGLLSDKGEKKAAYEVLKNFYRLIKKLYE
ncbi:MAG: beta-glucuronidase [Cytophagaceae bacterium]|nr:beta-glucuronidase [Cytophagaceae bacterium]